MGGYVSWQDKGLRARELINKISNRFMLLPLTIIKSNSQMISYLEVNCKVCSMYMVAS